MYPTDWMSFIWPAPPLYLGFASKFLWEGQGQYKFTATKWLPLAKEALTVANEIEIDRENCTVMLGQQHTEKSAQSCQVTHGWPIEFQFTLVDICTPP